jgi:CRP-like cAMP-binding protein
VTETDGHGQLPDIEITVRFPGSCIALVAGGRMLYRRPEILKDESDRICAHALLSIAPAAEALAMVAAGGGDREVPEITCTSPGCGAIFSMRALTPEESASLGTPTSVSARQQVIEPAHSKRVTKRLSKIDDPTDTPLLSRLAPELVQEIADLSLVSQYDTPTVIIEEGQEGQALYIVGDGELEVVTQTPEGDELVLATLHKGECFGEISLMTGQPATATVRSKGASAAVLVLPREKLDDLLFRRKALHREFSRIVAYRLYRNNVALEAESHQGLNGRLSMIGIIDLIQTLHASRRTGTLALNDSSRSARVGFRDGEVSSATLDDTVGEGAFFDVITWEDGYFSFEGGEPQIDATPGAALSGGTMGLLMEGLRRIDEKGRKE